MTTKIIKGSFGINSLKNTIDPENIKNYGADAEDYLFYQTVHRDVQWSEEGIVSSFKFVQNYELNSKVLEELKKNIKQIKMNK